MLPSGTVTFLFTDIEGSTKLWQQFPSAMPSALARHHEILQRAIETHNGYVFQIIGDAFCAAFATAFDGLDAALDAQRALRDYAWGKTGAIRVRMALHTGAAEVRVGEFTSGEYVSGITLSRAARLLSAGHGGQILLSSPSAELVREQLPPNIALRDMGAHRLKDLVQPQQIFQILAFDLPQEFPPLKTLDALPNNLPIQLTSFVGREREIAEITGLLTTDGRPQTTIAEAAVRRQSSGVESHSVIRLLTLTGAGGSGKTRLSLQVAAEVIDEFDKGAWFVELAPIAEASLVPNAVMSALGLREEAGRAPRDALTDYLRAKTLLLVLDNCEHLVEASAQLAHHLLTQCPNLKILATSREALGIAGEVTYQVPPLGIPDDGRRTADDEYTARITQYDAVRLFIERALAVQPNFSVTNANAPAVAQICFRLDGIPLALELAAARIKLFSPEQIAARLDDRFRLLTGGSRTAMPRQQTLRAAIEWSYSLLSDAERILFRRLAVFAGGWTFEAAEQVCAGDGIDALDILELLAHLVDKSLVTTEARGEETRYRMLETIRQYAQEKLDEAGEAEHVRAQHLDFFANFVVDIEPKLYTFDQVEMFNRLEAEHDNFRAALAWGIGQNVEQALRLSGALGRFWHVRGYHVAGRMWLEKILKLDESNRFPRLRAKALCEAGMINQFLSELKLARSMLEESVALWGELGDKHGLVYGTSHLGGALYSQGDYAAARALLEKNIALCREIGARWELGFSLFWHAYAAYAEQDHAAALASVKESIRLLSQVGDENNRAAATGLLGMVASALSDYATASLYYEQGLAGMRQVQDYVGIAIFLSQIGHNEVKLGNFNRAERQYQESLSIWEKIGNRESVAWHMMNLAHVATLTKRPTRAATLLGAAAALLESSGVQLIPDDQAEFEQNVAAARERMGSAEFEIAWTEGRALTMEQAIELAMQDE